MIHGEENAMALLEFDAQAVSVRIGSGGRQVDAVARGEASGVAWARDS